jgi:hypothetical protein
VCPRDLVVTRRLVQKGQQDGSPVRQRQACKEERLSPHANPPPGRVVQSDVGAILGVETRMATPVDTARAEGASSRDGATGDKAHVPRCII